MSDIETRVAGHYSGATLLEVIKSALKAAGADPEQPTLDDLKPVDEFHTGGREATDALLDQLEITPEMRVLDIGCGLGGAARHVADRTGAHVRGFDLTPDFVATGQALSAMTGLDGQTTFQVGSALRMPEPEDSVDLALMFHVGMNIADKDKLFAETARVLAPGGRFALFDVMQLSDAPLTFPFPWAEEGGFSFVEPPERYRAAATAAGLTLEAERERAEFTKQFFARALARMEEAGGPPPVGIHLLMHDTGKQKIENYVSHVHAGDLAPVEMIFRAPG